MGLRIALASSTQLDVIERVLKLNGIYDEFELLVTGAQFKRSKPDPEIYHYTAASSSSRRKNALSSRILPSE